MKIYTQLTICLASLFIFISCSSSSDDDQIMPEQTTKPISISSYSPTSGLQGDIITIVGENFGETTTQNNVKFGSEMATILSASSTQIKVDVPSALTTNNSQITLTVNDVTTTVGDFTILTDDFKYLVVNDNGKLHEIGNNTGLTSTFGDLNTEVGKLIFNTIVNTEDKIYALEYVYDPGPTNRLIIYDKTSKQLNKIDLELPTTITGDEPGMYALTWDDTNQQFVGLLNTNVIVGGMSHVVAINGVNYSVTDTGITFTQNSPTDIIAHNNKFYTASFNSDFLEVDLINMSVNTIEFNVEQLFGTRIIGGTNTNTIYAMEFDSSYSLGYNPVSLDLISKTKTELSNSTDFNYGFVSSWGKGFYQNEKYINLVSSNTIYLGILTYDGSTFDLVEVRDTNLERNIFILGTTD